MSKPKCEISKPFNLNISAKDKYEKTLKPAPKPSGIVI